MKPERLQHTANWSQYLGFPIAVFSAIGLGVGFWLGPNGDAKAFIRANWWWIAIAIVVSFLVPHFLAVWTGRRQPRAAEAKGTTNRASCPIDTLPPAPEKFTGRKAELASVIDRILSAEEPDRPAVCFIDGAPGVGKTGLAIKAGHDLREHFPDARLFIECGCHGESHQTDREVAERVLRLLDPNQPPGLPVRYLWDAYSAVFRDKRCLLILDDIRDDAQLTSLLPAHGNAVIATSRSRQPTACTLSIQALPLADGITLLRALCKRLSDEEAEGIAQRCEGLPVALAVAGGYLNQVRSESPDLYLRKLQESDAMVALRVQTVFETSYVSLCESEKAAWYSLSVFTASFDRPAALSVIGGEEQVAARCLGTLEVRHLLEYDSEENRFRWHALLREFAAKKGGDRDAALLRHAGHYIGLSREYQKRYLEGGANVVKALDRFDVDRGHIESAFDWLQHRDDPASTKLLVELGDSVRHLLAFRTRPPEEIEWLNACVKAAHRCGDRPAEERALGSLGGACLQIGNAKRAVGCQKARLASARKATDARSEGIALTNIAAANVALGNVHEAWGQLETALAIHRDLGNRGAEACTIQGMAACRLLSGDTAEAEVLFKQALAIQREEGDRRAEAENLGNLGCACSARGNPVEAFEHFNAALSIYRELGDPGGQGDCLLNLSGYHIDAGETEIAKECCEQALAVVVLGKDRQTYSSLLGNLAIIARTQGDLNRATDLWQQQLEISREIGFKRGEGNALHGLGSALLGANKPSDAKVRFQQQLELTEQIQDLKGQGDALLGLGVAHCIIGDTELGMEFCRGAIAISHRLGHRGLEANALRQLGIGHRILNEPIRAAKVLGRARGIHRRIANRGEAACDMGELGVVLMVLGKAAKAEEYHRRELLIARELGNRRGEEVALRRLAEAKIHRGDGAGALPLYKEYLAITIERGLRKAEGDAQSGMGASYMHLEKHSDAMEALHCAIEIYREVGEPGLAAMNVFHMAEVHLQMGQRQRALEMANDVVQQLEASGCTEMVNFVKSILDHWKGKGT